jgi:hypothetical protein
MATLTQMRNGAALWHDADTDRTALHERFAAWQETDGGRAIEATNVDTFSFELADGTWVHTIVATITTESEERKQLRERAEDAEWRLRSIVRHIQHAQDRLTHGLALARSEGGAR